ncbi:MAG TPA: argininosuccinate synthase [Planctomycetota bacterium]|nr:argininosuccinate synthase [Planctomycetota bacterium]
MPKVALAYSGSLDTTICVHHLRHHKGLKVYTFSANLGQPEDLAPLAEKAVDVGASAANLADLREKFAREYIFPCIRANAVYEQGYFLFSALSRPLIVEELVKIADEEGCESLAHGSRGIGNDMHRIENCIRAIAPSMRVVTPLVELGLRSPKDDLEYAKKTGLTVPADVRSSYNVEQNLWGNNIQLRDMRDTWEEPPKDTYLLTVPPEDAPAKPVILDIEFKQGDPVALNGQALDPVRLIEELNQVGGKAAVGRFDVVENRISGLKTREIYESPAAALLLTAHRALESITLEREVLHFKDSLSQRYADLVYEGKWFLSVRQGLDAFFAKVNENVTGTVRLSLCRGALMVVGRKSPFSLFVPPAEKAVAFPQTLRPAR